MKTPLAVLLFALSAMSVSARDWTNAAGKTIQAELVEVKGAAGAEVAVLKLASGQVAEVPLAGLCTADQAFAKAALAAKTAAPSSAPSSLSAMSAGASSNAATAAEAKPSIFKELLKGKLVALTGKRVGKYEMAEEPKYYAFYFSALWCPPCRAFTPKLVDFYNAQEGRKKAFEIIFVSNDNDENAMEEYIKTDSMPWPAIAYRHVERMKEIRKYAGSGIPCLVLVDREGKVLADSYQGKTYLGPTKVMNEIPGLTAK